MKKKTKVAIELIEKYLETTMGQDDQVLLEEKKYHFINKFSPKKCPNEQVKREDIRNLYSWIHHAPQTWFAHHKRVDKEIQDSKSGKAPAFGILCSNCQAPEGTEIKHKVCSACKQVYYCSAECQKAHWKAGHNKQCKELQKRLAQVESAIFKG